MYISLNDNWRSLLRPWYRAFKQLEYAATLPYYRALDRFRLNNLEAVYSDEYFDKRTEHPYDEGAKIVVDELYDRYRPNSVLDVGCAIGVYLKYFKSHGVDQISGIEGAQNAVDRALVDNVRHADLRDGPISRDKHELVLCIEVAEHLHPIYADKLVSTIISGVSNGGLILFTAAQPGQYGTHHVNLQPRRYWTEKFGHYGWKYQARETSLICAELRERMDNPLRMTENMYIFTKD